MTAVFEKVELAGGRAVLYRGDCLGLLAAGMLKNDAIVSDPPYGIGFQHGGNHRAGIKSSTATIIGDDVEFDPAPWVLAAGVSHYQRLSALVGPCGEPRIVIFGANHFMRKLPEGGTLLAWDKHVGSGPDDSFTDCEWAWCGKKVKREVFRHLWKGVISNREPDDAVPGFERTGGGKSPRAHISQKPVALMRWCIEKLKPPVGSVILDPYAGSGTTGIAALSLGYRFIGVEIDPGHFATACARIEKYWAEHGSAE